MSAAQSPGGGGTTVVACCQLRPQVGDATGNRARADTAIRRAAASGGSVVVLPELTTSGYSFTDAREAASLAEPVPGPSTEHWQELAAELGVTIVAGVCEDGGDGSLFNAAVIVDRSGVLAAYRKVHLWDREKLVFTPGDRPPPVVDVGGRRVSVMVCYDVEFPEWVRLPALQGADLLCVPANWPRFPRPEAERPMEIVRVQASASVNRMYIAACDRVGMERGNDWVGGSVIVDADGWPLAGGYASPDVRVLVAECRLDEARNKSISPHNDVQADRRPELYAPEVLEGGAR
jgi:predicted amidohydrolase